MSIKPILILSLMSLLSGCITTEVVVTLQPDGSGTVEYTSHFDRAPEDIRGQIRQQMNDGRSTTTQEHSRDNIREYYPEPHFKLMVHEEDREQLKTRIVLQFSDVNALLCERNQAHLGLRALDFKVAGDELLFSVKEEKLSQPWPEKYDEFPAREHIRIVNAQSGESVVFEREINSESEPADWSAPLAVPGHTITRRQVQVFHDYPELRLPTVSISSAGWFLRNHKSWSALKLKLLAELPADGSTYVRWEKPVVLNGAFFPEAPLRFRPQNNSSQGGFDEGDAAKVELEFEVPERSVEGLSASTVRLLAWRCMGQQEVEVGLIKPNTEYSFDGFTLKTDGLNSDRLGFRLKGATERLKGVLIQTKRGNRFPLKWASSSGLSGEVSRSYWELLPLEGCTLILNLYNQTEPCYLDLPIPALDLTQRSWRVENDVPEDATTDWQAPMQAEHPDLYETSVPPVEAALFEDKQRYKDYFAGLTDQQLMPALVQVVDHMVRHNPDKGQYWIQEIARTEIGNRTAWLEANRKAIARQLVSLYRHTPKREVCLTTFFSALRLQEFSHPLAIELLRQENYRFADDNFYGPQLSAADVAVLKAAFERAGDWIQKKALLGVLRNTGGVDSEYLAAVLSDRSIHEFVRSEIVSEVASASPDKRRWAQQIANDPSENIFVRNAALQVLMQEEPFPVETLLAFMADPEGQSWAVTQLDSFLNRVRRDSKDDPEARTKIKALLEPFIPLLEDLSEQLKAYEAKKSIDLLEKTRTL